MNVFRSRNSIYFFIPRLSFWRGWCLVVVAQGWVLVTGRVQEGGGGTRQAVEWTDVGHVVRVTVITMD